MLTKEILDSHPLKVLKSEIAKSNIKGYSNMKRSELTALMLKHKDKFHHIKAAEKKAPKASKAPKAKAPKGKGVNLSEKELLSIIKASEKAGKPQLTEKQLLKFIEASHEMPDGTKMTGKVHSSKSKPIKEFVNKSTGLKSKYDPKKGPKKPRSEKQKANDKKLGEAAKKRAKRSVTPKMN